MLTQYQWHRGAIGCSPVSTQTSAVNGLDGKRFGCKVSSFTCSELGSPVQSRFQVICKAPNESLPRRSQRSVGDYNSLEKLVCRSAVLPNFADIEAFSNWPQMFSPFPLLPLAATFLVFSRAASLMVALSKAVQTSEIVIGTRSASDAHLVEEFIDAAKGSLPLRPGLENALMQQGGISLALLSATAIAQDHLNPIFATLRANPTFMSGLIAWAMAQIAKVFTYYMVVRKWDFRMVMGSGGMPSSHSALCFALTTSVAFVHGVSDALFPVCLGFTLIVMYDAAGVRRHAGRQAEVLNMIVADLFQGHPISERKLKELLGHTPLQVFVGASLGVIVGYLCSRPRLT